MIVLSDLKRKTTLFNLYKPPHTQHSNSHFTMASPSLFSSDSPSSRFREVQDWSPAKWAYYEEVCHDILLPDWDDLTVGERSEWEGMFEREREKAEEVEKDKKENKVEKRVQANGMGTARGTKRGREEDPEDREGGEVREDHDGGQSYEFGVDGVVENAKARKKWKGKRKGKEIERAIGDSKTSILGRGSRKAKLEGDSKRRKQMLKDDSAQADEIEDEAEDERPQAQRRKRKRQAVEEYQPPRHHRQGPSTSTVPAPPQSNYGVAYQNQIYETQSNPGGFPPGVPLLCAQPASTQNFDRLVTGPVQVPARVYVSPYPALSTVAPGKGVFEGADEGPAKVGGEGMRRDGGVFRGGK